MSEQAMQGIESTNLVDQPLVDEVTAAAPQSLEASLLDAAGVGFVPSEELIAELKTNPPSAELKADMKQLEVLALAAAGEAVLEGVQAGVLEIREVRERPNYNFIGRGETNLIVHRRRATDKHHVFDFVDAVGGSWYHKEEGTVTSEPAGVQPTHEMISALAEETLEFFQVIEVSGGEKRQDEGDVKNLTKLKNFVDEDESTTGTQLEVLASLLRAGIRSINIGERLIQKAVLSKSKQINGTITIGYQINGQEGVNRYRLVGDISRDLIISIAKLGGELVDEVLKKPEPQEPKTAVKAVAKNSEQQKPVQQGQTNRSDAAPGNAQLSRRLIETNEALIMEQRRLQKQVDALSAANKRLQDESKAQQALLKEVLASNDAIMKAVGVVTKALLDR